MLALDLASQTGWAIYAEGMDRPACGSLATAAKNGDNGRALEKLRLFLVEKNDLYGGFSDIVFEAQHIGGNVNPQTIFLLIALGGFVEWWAYRMKYRVFCCDISTWRKHFLGRGSFKKKTNEAGKTLVTARFQAKAIDACAAFGWFPPDDNAADALGILDYFLSIMPASTALPRPWRDATFMAGYRA